MFFARQLTAIAAIPYRIVCWKREWNAVFDAHAEKAANEKLQIKEEDIKKASKISDLEEILRGILRFFFIVEGLTRLMRLTLRFTPSIFIGRIRRFLDIWDAEEVEHARVILAVAENKVVSRDQAANMAEVMALPGLKRTDLLIMFLLFPIAPMLHVLFGAIAETVTSFGYSVLLERTKSRKFKTLISKIRAQESAHYQVYVGATRLFFRIPGMRRIGNYFVAKYYRLPGAALTREGEAEEVARFLFPNEDTVNRFRVHLNKWLGDVVSDKNIELIVEKTLALTF